MIKKFISGVKKGKVKMAKLRKCDECAIQGICKLEDDYRRISKEMDAVYDSDSKDSYFSMPELKCHRFIRQQPISRTNAFAESSNEYLNNYIGEANKNGRA